MTIYGTSFFIALTLYIQPSFDDERRFAKIIAGWSGDLACHQKAFQPTIPDS